MKVIALGGVPASGKTTLMKALLRSLPLSVLRKVGTVVFHEWADERIIVLGDYSKAGKFKGTDRLSMSVQPQVLGFLQSLKGQEDPNDEWRVLFEGDRLFNSSFLWGCERFAGVRVFALGTTQNILEERHVGRWDKQTDKWLSRMESKVDKVVEGFKGTHWNHTTPQDTDRHVYNLLGMLGVAANSP